MTHPVISQGKTAYAKLLEAIRAGTYAQDFRLRKTDEAVSLNLSCPPVPKALHYLETDGITEHHPRIDAAIRRRDHNKLVAL